MLGLMIMMRSLKEKSEATGLFNIDQGFNVKEGTVNFSRAFPKESHHGRGVPPQLDEMKHLLMGRKLRRKLQSRRGSKYYKHARESHIEFRVRAHP
jgi:hypothetical protein